MQWFWISFPFDMDDKYNQFEMQAKGYLSSAVLSIENGLEYTLNLYESARFKHDVDEELKIENIFYEENVVLIKNVTKEDVLNAINRIFDEKIYIKMVPIRNGVETERSKSGKKSRNRVGC